MVSTKEEYDAMEPVVSTLFTALESGDKDMIKGLFQSMRFNMQKIWMKNDYDTSQEGVHLIEVMKPEDIVDGFYWKNKDDQPGVYILE